MTLKWIRDRFDGVPNPVKAGKPNIQTVATSLFADADEVTRELNRKLSSGSLNPEHDH